MPRIAALLQVVPDPVAGAYTCMLIVLLFRQGVRMVTTDGFDYEKGLIVCISFWAGLGFQFGIIFPDHLPEWSRGVLDNGMAAGGVVVMVLTLLVSLRQRAHRDVLEPSVRSLPTLHAGVRMTRGGNRARSQVSISARYRKRSKKARHRRASGLRRPFSVSTPT